MQHRFLQMQNIIIPTINKTPPPAAPAMIAMEDEPEQFYTQGGYGDFFGLFSFIIVELITSIPAKGLPGAITVLTFENVCVRSDCDANAM
jgi:hypothetical protein